MTRSCRCAASFPSEVEALENEIADLKARQTQDVAVIEAYNQTIAENRQNIVDCDTQIEKYQQQLNDISNSREYDSINKEIEGAACPGFV